MAARGLYTNNPPGQGLARRICPRLMGGVRVIIACRRMLYFFTTYLKAGGQVELVSTGKPSHSAHSLLPATEPPGRKSGLLPLGTESAAHGNGKN